MAFFGPPPEPAPSCAGVFAVHQLRLKDGAARRLHGVESTGAREDPAVDSQQQPLSDSALGAGAEPGEPYPFPGIAPTAARLARRLSRTAGSDGNSGR